MHSPLHLCGESIEKGALGSPSTYIYVWTSWMVSVIELRKISCLYASHCARYVNSAKLFAIISVIATGDAKLAQLRLIRQVKSHNPSMLQGFRKIILPNFLTLFSHNCQIRFLLAVAEWVLLYRCTTWT